VAASREEAGGQLDVAVIGAGAIGALLGGYISASAASTRLVDGWREHVDTIHADGLSIGGARGERTFEVEAVTFDELEDAAAVADVVFVAVKSQDTRAVLRSVEMLMSDATVVVSTQNGMNEELLADAFGSDRVVGAVAEVGAFLERPGRVIETREGGGFVIGELNGELSARAERIATLMSACAPTTVSANIVGLLWSKLLWNCMMNPLSALSGKGQGELILDEELRTLCFQIAREVGSLAAALDVELEPLGSLGVDPSALVSADSAVRSRAEKDVIRRYATQRDKTTSMRQDVLAGRPTEIDHLNGFVAARGRELGAPTPLNNEVVRLVHLLEDGNPERAAESLAAVASAGGL
jgi:2-dehydropantoate 2-reductase